MLLITWQIIKKEILKIQSTSLPRFHAVVFFFFFALGSARGR